MKKVRFSFELFSVFFLFLNYPVGNRTSIFKPGHYDFNLKLKGAVVRCSIQIVPYSHCPNMPSPTSGWGGDKDTLWAVTRTMFREVKLWVNDNEIEVPLSCYADLTNPDDASLLVTTHGYRLDIMGADGGLTYHATIDFDGKQVLKRAVHDVGGYAGMWEETVYHVDTTAWNY